MKVVETKDLPQAERSTFQQKLKRHPITKFTLRDKTYKTYTLRPPDRLQLAANLVTDTARSSNQDVL